MSELGGGSAMTCVALKIPAPYDPATMTHEPTARLVTTFAGTIVVVADVAIVSVSGAPSSADTSRWNVSGAFVDVAVNEYR